MNARRLQHFGEFEAHSHAPVACYVATPAALIVRSRPELQQSTTTSTSHTYACTS